MTTFSGTTTHGLDEKSRLIVPKRILDQVAPVDREFTLTGGLDGCIWMLSGDAWTALEDRFGKQVVGAKAERSLRRRLLGHAEKVTPDRSGRIPLKESLRRYAGIGEGEDVVVVGAGQVVEIWSQSRLDEAMAPSATDDEEQFFAGQVLVGSTGDTSDA